MTTTVGNAIKNRASNEEILIVLKDVPNPNQDDDDDGGSFFGLVHKSLCQSYSYIISLGLSVYF